MVTSAAPNGKHVHLALLPSISLSTLFKLTLCGAITITQSALKMLCISVLWARVLLYLMCTTCPECRPAGGRAAIAILPVY